MIEHSPHSSNTHSLWQQHRTMVVLVFAALAALAYYLYKRNQANAATTSTAAPQAGPAVSNTYVQRNVTVPGGPLPPVPGPTGTPTGPNPWLSPPPPGVNPASWNPYQYSNTPLSQQWPRPPDYTSRYAGGNLP